MMVRYFAMHCDASVELEDGRSTPQFDDIQERAPATGVFDILFRIRLDKASPQFVKLTWI